jgi:hypothetical protein
VVDGGFGLLTSGGSSSFDAASLKTNDPAFIQPAQSLMAAAPVEAPAPQALPLSEQVLAVTAQEATQRWSDVFGGTTNNFAPVRFAVADLPGQALGLALRDTVYIDVDAAGHGWFVGGEPFAGGMDLGTAVMHELGHVLGHEHEAGEGLMAPTLAARTPSSSEVSGIPDGAAGRTNQRDLALDSVGLAPLHGNGARFWTAAAQPEPTAFRPAAAESLVDWSGWGEERGRTDVGLERSRRWEWDVVDLAAGDDQPDINADIAVDLLEVVPSEV